MTPRLYSSLGSSEIVSVSQRPVFRFFLSGTLESWFKTPVLPTSLRAMEFDLCEFFALHRGQLKPVDIYQEQNREENSMWTRPTYLIPI